MKNTLAPHFARAEVPYNVRVTTLVSRLTPYYMQYLAGTLPQLEWFDAVNKSCEKLDVKKADVLNGLGIKKRVNYNV